MGAKDDVGLASVLSQIRACRVCENDLPFGPRPIVQFGSGASLAIIGQAPGRKVHASGVPWDDASGVRLRSWLGLSVEEFYDPGFVALMPMGFCYPGSASSGDLPPRPECAPLWHDRLLPFLAPGHLWVIIGAYAQRRYLADQSGTLTDIVQRSLDDLSHRVVLPHPSPRNQGWFAKNPWFATELLPRVQARIATLRLASRL